MNLFYIFFYYQNFLKNSQNLRSIYEIYSLIFSKLDLFGHSE